MFFWYQNSPSSSPCHFLVSLSPIFFSSWVPHFHFFSAIIFEDTAPQETVYHIPINDMAESIWEPLQSVSAQTSPPQRNLPSYKTAPQYFITVYSFVVVQSLRCVWLCDPMDHSTAGPHLSPFPMACSNSCPLSWWCYPTISSSVVPYSTCLQSFPASGSFLMSQLFASGGQSIGASASSSVLPMNIQVDFFRIDWFDLLAVQGTLKSLLQHHSSP